MKKQIKTTKNLVLLVLFALALIFGTVSCSDDSDSSTPAYTITSETGDGTDPTNGETATDFPDLYNINYTYPSCDVDGKKVTLSAAVTMRKEFATAEDKNAALIILYNHYTVLKSEDCPTEGKLEEQNIFLQMLAGGEHSNVIFISADYIGFGATSDRIQAYCYGDTNARASLDALIAAKKLLTDKGYTWDDLLLNCGYSQGGQTAIAVQKLVDTDKAYSDIKITETIAGGGPYDIAESYGIYVENGSDMPCSVALTLATYNELSHLNIPYNKIFKGELLTNYEDWLFGKKYTTGNVDDKIGSTKLEDFVADELLDLTSEGAKKFTEAFNKYALTSGWTPNPDDNIYLCHSEIDEVVPFVNATKLKSFLEAAGVTVKTNFQNAGTHTSFGQTGWGVTMMTEIASLLTSEE